MVADSVTIRHAVIRCHPLTVPLLWLMDCARLNRRTRREIPQSRCAPVLDEYDKLVGRAKVESVNLEPVARMLEEARA